MQSNEINWNQSSFVENTKPLPPPVLSHGHPFRELVCEKIRAVEVRLAPMSRQDMAVALYQLQGHYWRQDMSESLAKSVASDYLRLLGDYPKDVFTAVCDEWLLNPENEHFPKVGKLKEMLERSVYRHKWYLRRLRILLGEM